MTAPRRSKFDRSAGLNTRFADFLLGLRDEENDDTPTCAPANSFNTMIEDKQLETIEKLVRT
ncbi:MAG: hypothetical protein F4039_04730 [Gammaproteobacteria bacterium]|nr:hypothetical protein [Gammaproteobacteria bacterium]